MTDDSITRASSGGGATPDPVSDGGAGDPGPLDADSLDALLGPPDRVRRRRRRLIISVVAGVAVLVVLVCAVLGAAAVGVGRAISAAQHAADARDRVAIACLALEQRLNRLAPPGAATSPGRRAAAIRDENAAVQPFLDEIEALRDGRSDLDEDDAAEDDADRDADTGWRGWADRWRKLVAARASFADALDRQVTSGAPAFFIAPRDAAGRPVLHQLERGAESCAGAARRLAAPDL